MTAIQTQALSRVFGQLRAVDGVDLAVQENALFSLLGPNGAGKTTTIRLLCCLLKPSNGKALVLGHDVQKEPLRVKELIGLSPQETALADQLSARENLLLIGRSHGLGKKSAQAKSEELLDLMGLQERSKERVKRFSGGMKRRLSIAMALISSPQVLFLDEPTLGLDPQARVNLWEHIRSLKSSMTIVLTTHYLEEADALADRIAIQDHGKIVARGTSQELKDGVLEQDIMTLEAEGLSGDAIEAIRAVYPDVVPTEQGVEIRADKIDFYAIQDVLRPRGIVIRSMQLKETSLDDAFLHYTGRELRE